MSPLTLLLIVGLCADGPDPVCSYMDVTQRMQVESDLQCYDLAIEANRHNIETGQTPRYDCVLPANYLALIGEKPAPTPTEAVKPRRVL